MNWRPLPAAVSVHVAPCRASGVSKVVSGYTGGHTENPTYEAVCRGYGHYEAVQIAYDPAIVSYETCWSCSGGRLTPPIPGAGL